MTTEIIAPWFICKLGCTSCCERCRSNPWEPFSLQVGIIPLALFTDVIERKVTWSLYCPDSPKCSFSSGQEVTRWGPMMLRDCEHRNGGQRMWPECGRRWALRQRFFSVSLEFRTMPQSRVLLFQMEGDQLKVSPAPHGFFWPHSSPGMGLPLHSEELLLAGKVEVPEICVLAQRVTGPMSLSFGALGRFDNAEK